jgi:adenylate cyclase
MNKPSPLRWHTKFVLTLGVLALTTLFCLSPWGRACDHFVYDSLFLFKGPVKPPPEIVIVAIDEPSMGLMGMQWPWPRGVHAKLVDTLFAHGARVVAMDILFAEPSAAPAEDKRLAEAVAKNPNVILASELNVLEDSTSVRQTVVEPFAELTQAGALIGLINLPQDIDGFIRRVNLSNGPLKAMSLVAAERFCGSGGRTGSALETVCTPGGPEAEINFLGPARTVRTLSYYQALDPDRHLPKGFFEGKLVFVGFVTQSTVDLRNRAPDYYSVPFSRWSGGCMAGVEIHAHAAANLIRGNSITRPPFAGVLFSALVLSIVSGSCFLQLRLLYGGLLLLFELLAAVAATYILFSRYSLYLPIILFVLPAASCYVLSPFTHYLYVWRENSFIRKAFATYLAPPLVDQLLEQPDRLKLGGESVQATVLFLDVAGFTSLSEKLQPEVLVQVMNRYLSEFTDIVFRWGGMVDKYIGDAVMAVWGIPIPLEDNAGRACCAALEMREAVERLGLEDPAGQSDLRIRVRIGINSGRMVAGNVGGDRHFNYTVLGDEVNLASRLEAANREYGTVIMIGQNTREAVREDFELRELDTIRVKGKKTPVGVHELQCAKGKGGLEQMKVNEIFAAGRELYLARNWPAARHYFELGMNMNGGDGPCRTYLERCKIYENSPPGPDWDGTFTMLTK